MTMTTDEDRYDSPAGDAEDEDLAEAEREAELARASFTASVRTASLSGVQTVKRVARSAKPILIGALVVGGAAVLVAAARLARRSRATDYWAPPRKPSLLGSLVRTAATRLLLMGAARLAERYLQPRLEEPSPLPAAGVPR